MSLALSPDGRMLATGASDGTIQLWDVSSRQAIGPSLAGHGGWVDALAFTPDGTMLVSRGGLEDTAPRLWRVALSDWGATACRMAGRNLSRGEWAQFLGSEKYQQTCPELPEPVEQTAPTPVEQTAPTPVEQTAPTPSAVGEGPLDLAAIVVPEGFGQYAGITTRNTQTLDEYARAVADIRGEVMPTVRSVLEAAGWQRQQGTTVDVADVASIGESQVYLDARYGLLVTQYETAEGAAAAFTYLEHERGRGGTPIPLAIPFGEQAIATHESGTDSDGYTYEYERIVFRFDNLIAQIEIWGYGNTMDIMPGLAESLGAGLRERIASVRTRGGPGLGNRALRLVGDEIADTGDRDRYLRLGTKDLLTFDEKVFAHAPPEGPADRIRSAVDVCRVYAATGDTPSAEYTVYLFAYPSSEIASSIFAALGEDLNDWATPVTQDPPPTFLRTHMSNDVFGEESVTVAQRRWVGEPDVPGSYELRGYVTWARVGAEIVVMHVETPAQPPPLALANELMTAQVTCLQATEICEPVPVPAAFSSVAAATPETASGTPQVIAGVVSLDPD